MTHFSDGGLYRGIVLGKAPKTVIAPTDVLSLSASTTAIGLSHIPAAGKFPTVIKPNVRLFPGTTLASDKTRDRLALVFLPSMDHLLTALLALT